MKKTVVIGASPNPTRYSHKAVKRLTAAGHPVEAVGIRTGRIGDIEIITERLEFENVDTVTLYVGPKNQEGWKEYIRQLKPQRVIFNPGTENSSFENDLEKNGIATERACTLVLLSLNEY